ncbi:TIGR03086 family metal-binding protein [Streptomyces albus]|uniref:TIGR03086 family metal-binding protein n=1 Tax=Streptomyces albus TaxID=1888 RepID=UPI003F1B9692
MNSTHDIPDPRPVYARAAGQLARTVAAVGPGHLSAATPCAEYDVRALLGHVVGGTRRIAAVAEGGSAEGPDVPAWTSEVPAEEWPRLYDEASARLTAAWADDTLLDAPVTVPWGRVPGRIALAGSVMETVTHTWDLARALGRDQELDEELAAFALTVAQRALPAEGREHAPFGAVRSAPQDAGAQARLVAWLGRDPEWSAPAADR